MTLMVRSASGSVELSGGARSVRCDTSSGDVHLAGLLGPVGIAPRRATSSPVSTRWPPTDEVRITTSSGRVRVALPPGTEPGGELDHRQGRDPLLVPGRERPEDDRGSTSPGKGPKVFITTTSSRIELF